MADKDEVSKRDSLKNRRLFYKKEKGKAEIRIPSNDMIKLGERRQGGLFFLLKKTI